MFVRRGGGRGIVALTRKFTELLEINIAGGLKFFLRVQQELVI